MNVDSRLLTASLCILGNHRSDLESDCLGSDRTRKVTLNAIQPRTNILRRFMSLPGRKTGKSSRLRMLGMTFRIRGVNEGEMPVTSKGCEASLQKFVVHFLMGWNTLATCSLIESSCS